jgi:DNA-binding transcriptional MocR family regulator
MKNVPNPNKVINNFLKTVEATANTFASGLPKLVFADRIRKELIQKAKQNTKTLDDTLEEYKPMLTDILRSHHGQGGTVVVVEIGELRKLIGELRKLN